MYYNSNGWTYDIGFGGSDQVLSSDDNINILVLELNFIPILVVNHQK